jgi:hypothetical protein
MVGIFMTSFSLVDGQQKRLKTKSVSSAEIFSIIHKIKRRLKSGHMNKHLGCREKFKSHVNWVIIFITLFTTVIRMEVHGIYRDRGCALEHEV